MFSGARKIFNYFSGSGAVAEAKGKEDDHLRKTGRVSFLNEDYGMIDGNLEFSTRVVRGKIAVGDMVTYLSEKPEAGKPGRVVCVELCVDFNVLQEVSEPSFSDDTEKIEDAVVSRMIGRRLVISQLNTHCDLDKISCNFIPREGDYLCLTIEPDDNPSSEGGNACRIVKVIPKAMTYGTGVVTSVKKNGEGAIGNEIFFTGDVAARGFSAKVGNFVKFTAIESIQGRYRRRALCVENADAEGGPIECNKHFCTQYKSGILVRGKLQFGPMHLSEKAELFVSVLNNGKIERKLTHLSSASPSYKSQVKVKEPRKCEDLIFLPGQHRRFVFQCKARFLGINTEVFDFCFHGFKLSFSFTVNVTNAPGSDDAKALGSGCNEKALDRKKNMYAYQEFDFSDAYYGMKVAHTTRYSAMNKCSYNMPEDLFKIVLGDADMWKTRGQRDVAEAVLRYCPSLNEELRTDNYKERFHALLYLEEIEDRIRYRKFDLHDVVLRRRREYLALEIPPVVEGKIVLGIGTQVILTQSCAGGNVGKQVGYIHDVRDHEIQISFHESFHRFYDESECDIMFQPSRTTYIRSHVAIDMALANIGTSWLFPSELTEKRFTSAFDDAAEDISWNELASLNMSDLACTIDDEGYVVSEVEGRGACAGKSNDWGINWFNKNLNAQQKGVVKQILDGRGATIPYVIKGPVGSGKTATVIELAMQIYTRLSGSRIIIAAPSNKAADLVCGRLVGTGNFSPGQLIRLLSFGRLIGGKYPPEIGPYCRSIQEDTGTSKAEGNGKARYFNVNENFGSERIVIGTCCTLSVLHNLGLKPGHFTHAIIDEATQITEPESLIPINFLDGKRGQVILTGDTEQLSSITVNYLSGRFGYSKSLMERISGTAPYSRNNGKYPETDGFDPRCVTRLRYN